MNYLPNDSKLTSMFSCNKCKRGLFLFNNTCIEKCPENYRADKMTWNCIQNPIFAWYWNYPSKSSCRSVCNKKYNNTENLNDKTLVITISSSANITDDGYSNKERENNSDSNKNSNYIDYSKAPAILNKIDENLKIKDDIAKDSDSNTDCACDLGCQQRGNCCYDFDLYCLKSSNSE